MVEALLMGALAAFGGIDINGAHTSHLSGGCSGEDGRTCALVVPEWTPNAKGRGGKLPFERAGRITRIKLPVSGPTTITIRVVRRTSLSSFRVRRSSAPLTVRRKGWLDVPLQLSYRKGDTIAIGQVGPNGGPYLIHGGQDPSPNGSGDVLWAKDDGARWVRRAYGGNDGDRLGNQGVSMILTTRR
jgi:hypothetical protein